ncbi:MAG: hypothetical protein SFW07_05720 [Gammaproteobacteria bacterium]|nr:hypothetical protein [Gammaproteobacteria bacterium]
MSGEKVHANENRELNLLRGTIPKTHAPIYFTEEEVEGKGDCGFISLGKERSEVADTLLSLSSDESARAQLWEEIYESFVIKALKRPALFDSIYNMYQEPNISEEVREEIRKVLEKYCTREMIYKAYVNAYREKLWLGYKSALLYAKKKNMTVYVWKKESPNNIKVIDSFVSENTSTIVHMLLTQRSSHFNLLVETQEPVLEAKEVKTNKVRYLNPEDEGHRSFAEWVMHFTKEEIEALFVDPADYGEEVTAESTPIGDTRRVDIARGESYARSVIAENNYKMLSAAVTQLVGYKDISTPILNEEMINIVKAALKMELDITDDIDVMEKLMTLLDVLEPTYINDLIAGKSPPKKKKKVTFANPNQTAFFKPNEPSNQLKEMPTLEQKNREYRSQGTHLKKKKYDGSHLHTFSNGATVVVDRFVPVESTVEPPKSQYTIPGNTYAFFEDGKFVEKQNASEIKRPQPKSSSDIKQKSVTPINVFDCLQADSGEVLKKTSPHGFNTIEHKTESLTMENVGGPIEKKAECMRLKDSSGHYIDFFKDGSAKTSQYEVTDNAEAVATEMLKALLAMLNVYVVLCDQKGVESVLPKGEVLNPQFSIVKSSDNSEKIRGLIVNKLKMELLHSQYDLLRERICFDGKKLFSDLKPKEKQEEHESCSIRFSK